MTFPSRGFMPTRTLTGKRPILREYSVFVNSNHAYYIGDLVYLRNDGTVAVATAAVSANFLGVIQSCLKSRNGRPAPLTFNQPTRGPFLTSGESGFVRVNVDPEQLYAGRIDVSASAGLIGNTVHVSGAQLGNTRTGLSGMSLAGATLGTDAERPFKVVGITAAEEALATGDFAAGTGVEVKLNNGIFNTTTGV